MTAEPTKRFVTFDTKQYSIPASVVEELPVLNEAETPQLYMTSRRLDDILDEYTSVKFAKKKKVKRVKEPKKIEITNDIKGLRFVCYKATHTPFYKWKWSS